MSPLPLKGIHGSHLILSQQENISPAVSFKHTASVRGSLASLRDREKAEKFPFPNQSFSVTGCRMQCEANSVRKVRGMILGSRLAGVIYLFIILGFVYKETCCLYLKYYKYFSWWYAWEGDPNRDSGHFPCCSF